MGYSHSYSGFFLDGCTTEAGSDEKTTRFVDRKRCYCVGKLSRCQFSNHTSFPVPEVPQAYY